MRLKLAIEVIEHDPRFDDATAARHIQIKDVIKVFRTVDHEGVVDGLAAL